MITNPNKQPLKSLNNILKGKQKQFQQNLLNKHIDYSKQSVIVINPKLKLHQYKLPKKMALKLFKPFIYNQLKKQNYITTIKNAKKIIEKKKNEI